MKTALIVLLVVLVLLTGLPLAGMMMADDLCPSCDMATSMVMCFILVASIGVALPRLLARAFAGRPAARELLLARTLERPPRLP